MVGTDYNIFTIIYWDFIFTNIYLMCNYLISKFNLSTNKHRCSIKLWKLTDKRLEQNITSLLIFFYGDITWTYLISKYNIMFQYLHTTLQLTSIGVV